MENPRAYNSVPWSISIPDILADYETHQETGLSEIQASERLKRHGINALPKDRSLKQLRILARQFASPLIIILVIGGFVTGALKEWTDSIAIFSAVLVNVLLGWYQEGKAERALAALQDYTKDFALVIRGEQQRRIEATQLVIGDIVHIQHGDRVPADGRLIQATDCEIDESLLTGESLPVEKTIEVIPSDTLLPERTNMVHMGTTIVEGYADFVVTATGATTELGRIATALVSTQQTVTPLQKKLTRFTYQIGILVIGMAIALFFFGIARGMSAYDMFMISVAVGVSAVPEGLPIALTVILAIGVERMARNKGVIRNLLAAETLGSATVVLTDKTGTLTEARMQLATVSPYADYLQKDMISSLVLHADAIIENPDADPAAWSVIARPIEVAIVRAGAINGVFQTQVRAGAQLIERIPFSSSRKYSASLFQLATGRRVAIFFGAPERVAALAQGSFAVSPLMQEVDNAAADGDRVLALATLEDVPANMTLAAIADSQQLQFRGLGMFRDPIRTSVSAAVERIRNAGVRTIIVTGDHPATAQAVATRLGWKLTDDNILVGTQIEALSDDVLSERLRSVRVIARVTPEQKLRIARLLRNQGEVVAMTGDGVNDAPALREADIGIAVGSGSDVAKGNADLVLLDNNFEVIVLAIEEGRKILQNIRKVIAYLMSSVFDELVLIAGSLALGLSLPLSALQILWVNLMIGALPAVALAFESSEEDIGTAPLRMGRQLLDRQLRFLIFGIGMITSLLLLALYWTLIRFGFDPATVRTFIFAAFSAYALFLVFSIRSLRLRIWKYSFISNPYIIGSVIIGLLATGSAIYLPVLQRLLGTTPLSLPWVLGVVGFGVVSSLLIELTKPLFHRTI